MRNSFPRDRPAVPALPAGSENEESGRGLPDTWPSSRGFQPFSVFWCRFLIAESTKCLIYLFSGRLAGVLEPARRGCRRSAGEGAKEKPQPGAVAC